MVSAVVVMEALLFIESFRVSRIDGALSRAFPLLQILGALWCLVLELSNLFSSFTGRLNTWTSEMRSIISGRTLQNVCQEV